MPSQALLDTWNKREGALIEKHGSDCVPAVALPPEPKGAYIGQELKDAVRDKIHREGCRTIPGREHGGNCDIKNLSRGSRCFFPVFVEGAGLSLGDLHFSQGDGELSFCGAIEMAGITTLKVDIIKGGVEKFAMTMPVSTAAALSDSRPLIKPPSLRSQIFLPSPIDPMYAEKVSGAPCTARVPCLYSRLAIAVPPISSSLRGLAWTCTTARASKATWTPQWPSRRPLATPLPFWESWATLENRRFCS